MAFTLVMLFVVLPLAEIVVFVQIGQWIGFAPAIAILLGVTVLGVYVVKHQGLGVMRRAGAQFRSGQVPTEHLVDGALLALAGVLLVVPGFITAVIGLLLLVPPVRALARGFITRRFAVRAATHAANRGVVVVRSWRRDDPDSGVPPAIGQ